MSRINTYEFCMQVLKNIIEYVNSRATDYEGLISIYKHEPERQLIILKSGYLTNYANSYIQINYGITDDAIFSHNPETKCLFVLYSPYLISGLIHLNEIQLNNFLYEIRTNKNFVEELVLNPELRLREEEKEEESYHFINEDFSDPAQRQISNDRLSEYIYDSGKKKKRKSKKKSKKKRRSKKKITSRK